MNVSDERDRLLRAGNNKNHYQSTGHNDVDISGTSEHFIPNGSMLPARRTFCLFTTFDLILTFILWVIYTQIVSNDDLWQSLKNQVQEYTFDKSLFDTVMIAAARFTFIILAYALFRLNHWWVIAICTTMTCVYLLVKCFLFKFSDRILGGSNPLSYILLIVCFVLSWIETWMLDFKVLPTEKRLRAAGVLESRGHRSTSHVSDDISRLLSVEDTGQYYTPEGSEDELEHDSPYLSHQHARSSKADARKEEENYTQLLINAKEEFIDLLNIDDWKLETGTSLEEGEIYSRNVKKYGRKLFKLQGIIKMPPKDLCEDMVLTINDTPKWNPTVLESRTLQVLDNNTKIVYSISAEAAGGLVTSRDFVNLCQVLQCNEDTYISYCVACTHPDMPAQKKYIRGENGPSGWVFQSMPEDPDTCLFTWIVNANLKGWLPQAAIDQAMSGVLSSYLTLLKQRYHKVLFRRTKTVSC